MQYLKVNRSESSTMLKISFDKLYLKNQNQLNSLVKRKEFKKPFLIQVLVITLKWLKFQHFKSNQSPRISKILIHQQIDFQNHSMKSNTNR